MQPFLGTFKRKEVKYRLSSQQRQAIEHVLRERMMPDAYGRTQVSSLYYDTPRRDLIARSLEKPLYKEKLRLRWYGASAGTPVFVEMKKKHKGIVYKRRVATSRDAAEAWAAGMPYGEACERFPLPDAQLHTASQSACGRQMAREIEAMRGRHAGLRPSALIECERTAWVMPDSDDTSFSAADAFGRDLRITFDEVLHGTDLMVADPCAIPLIGEDEAIMEVKSAGPMPLWLVHALNGAGARPTSFSKYGELYQKGLAHA